jgi:hypothetical protein
LDQVFVSCQRFQDFNLPSDILYRNGCSHLKKTKQQAVGVVKKMIKEPCSDDDQLSIFLVPGWSLNQFAQKIG